MARAGKQQRISRIGQLRDRYQARSCCGENSFALALQHWPGRGQNESAAINQEKYVWQSEFRFAASTSTGWVSSAFPTESAEEPRYRDSTPCYRPARGRGRS